MSSNPHPEAGVASPAGDDLGARLILGPEGLQSTFDDKFAPLESQGWSPRLRAHYGHFSPDDHYETLMNQLVTPGCDWADVGCGHDIFPGNQKLARRLADRAGFLLGIDPSPNVRNNEFIDEGFEGMVEDYAGDRQFDVISMRMVAEHIADPPAVLEKLAAMTKPGGVSVIYTPFRFAPMSVLAALVPHGLHQPLKAWLWRTKPEDTFPVKFRMNTRAALERHFTGVGFDERLYSHLDDCRIFARFKLVSRMELMLWKTLHAIGLHYPETCLLAVHQKRTG